jgi:Asp-tRNA(Asn)/Glu-tRNA(Gln) amidotransferase A subunit family amidase
MSYKIEKDFFIKKSIKDIGNLIHKKELPIDLIFSNLLEKIELSKKYNYLCKYDQKKLSEKFSKLKNTLKEKKLSGCFYLAKDIFNTKDFSTEMGSKIWKNFEPGNNARSIDDIEYDGGFLLGKTTTAEFAVHYPNNCLNPRNVHHLVGTSSSGSAAAIALGISSFALATQSAGSISRPASYCGVIGVKPSFGSIPRTGVLKTCDTLDTIGFMTGNFQNCKSILNSIAVQGSNYPYNLSLSYEKKERDLKKIKIGFVKTHAWNNLKNYTKKSILNFIDKISEELKIKVNLIDWDNELSKIHKFHSNIYHKSLSYYFKREKKIGHSISQVMKKIIKEGDAINNNKYFEGIDFQNRQINKIDNLFDDFDLIIAPATVGEAPKINEEEVDDASLIWTFLHTPSIFYPMFLGPNNLPFGLHFVCKRKQDYRLINAINYLIEKNILSSKISQAKI